MGVVILKDKLFTGRNRVSSMIVLSKGCDVYTGYPILVSKNNANHGFVSLTQYLSYITLKTFKNMRIPSFSQLVISSTEYFFTVKYRLISVVKVKIFLIILRLRKIFCI